MKRHYLKKIKTVLFLSAIVLAQLSQAASGGTYTINATAAASSSNYRSFNAFFRDLLNGSRNDGGTSNGAGVGGPIILNVVTGSGPYTEQVTINQFSGISATNFIRINGNGNILQFTATSTAASHTLLLNGADFITIDNLTVLANSTTIGRCIQLMNDARSNTISNCTLTMPNMTGTSTANAYIGITQGTTTLLTYGIAGQDNVITGCTMSSITNGGPYAGVAVIDASSGTVVRKNTISNNKISNFRNFGLWIYYAFEQTITGNEIFNNSSTNISAVTYGIYSLCSNKGGDYTIENNYIHDLNTRNTTQYGIFQTMSYGTGSGNLSIRRNRVELRNLTSSAFGIYVYGIFTAITGNLRIDNNNVEIEQATGNTSNSYGIYNYGAYYSAFKEITNDNNYIRMRTPFRGYGILTYYLYNSQMTKRASMSNNLIDAQTNMDLYGGIYYYGFSNKEKTDICFNTIYTSNRAGGSITGTKYQLYLYYADGNVMNNNLVSADNGGTTFGIFDYFSTATFSNNNVFNLQRGNTYNHGARNNTAVSDLSSFSTAFSDRNAMSINPNFTNVSEGKYQPTSFQFVNKGIPVSGFSTDMNGVTRNSTNPDLGAIEYFVDVNISRLHFKGSNVCGGYKEQVSITMRNTSSDTLKSVPVRYLMGGKQPVTGTVSRINPNDTTLFTFTQIAEVNGSGSNALVAELDGTDDVVNNNSQSKALFITPSPSGFNLTETNNFSGYFRSGASGGSILNPDATIPGRQVKYEIDLTNAKGYGNSNFNTKWNLSGVFYTQSGIKVNGPVLNNPSGGQNATLTFDPSSSYTDSLIYLGVRVQDLNTGCDSIFGRWIYIPNIPVPSFTGTDVCEGNVAVFNNKTTLNNGIPVYLWKFNDKGTPEDSSSLIDPVFNFSTYGVYDVVLTAWNSKFPKFVTKFNRSITVTPVPEIQFNVINACEKVPVKFINKTTLPIAGTISYDWDFGDPSTNLDRSLSKDPSYTYRSHGGYKVTLKATANGCTGELTKNANQFATPKADFKHPALMCTQTEIQFSNASTIKIGNMGYTWKFEANGMNNFTNPIHKFETAGTKTVKMKTVSEFGCVDSITKTITVTESPKADFKFGTTCNLTNTDFTFTGTKPAAPAITNMLWSFPDKTTTTVENPSKLFTAKGKQKVTLTLTSNNGCSDVISKEINVKLQSKADFAVNDACEGDNAVFSNLSTVSSGQLTYNWKFGDGTKSGAASPRHNYKINGVTTTFDVTMVAIVPGGCSDSITKPVTINAIPDADFTYTTSGRLVYFKAKNTSSTKYFWRFGDGSSSDQTNPNYHYLQAARKDFQVCLTVENASGCQSEVCKALAISASIENEPKLTGLSIYPNPNNGQFNLTIDAPKPDLSIVVYDILGSVVKVIDTNTPKNTYLIDLKVPIGIYLVKVSNGGLSATHKITVR